jgi:hypothetical protein
MNGPAINGDLRDSPLFGVLQELRVRHLGGWRYFGSKAIEHRHQHHRDDHPQEDVFYHVIQGMYLKYRKTKIGGPCRMCAAIAGEISDWGELFRPDYPR